MARLSKKEFAERCGIETKNLAVYIGRGNVIVLDDDSIDDCDQKNRAFIQKRQVNIVRTEPKKIESPQNNDYAGLDLKKTAVQVEKLEQEVRLLKIKEEKLKGVVVPSELIKPVFLQHNQSIITEVHNNSTEFCRIFSKKHTLNVNDVAEMNGELIKWFNTAINKATSLSIKSIENIVNDYSEKKGVGERE
jgi:hypothetical protein